MTPIIVLLTCLGAAPEAASFRYDPVADQAALPERYRLAAGEFNFRLSPYRELPVCGIVIEKLTFPSPIKCECVENNTVHAEYYRPKLPGKYPGVIVLDITGGDQSLSRGIATYLAQNNINALFVQMAYYGPRRPPGSKLRMLSTDIPRTMDSIRQTVFDVRVAGAWLASRPEVDAKRIGIVGTSLGSFVAAICAETDPRFDRTALLLGGGGLVDAFWEHPQAKPYRNAYELLGGKKNSIKPLIAPVDPITLADKLRGRKVLMLNASRDEIVPPSASKALWEAAGNPTIRWYDTTHYGAALFIPGMLRIVVDHFSSD